ncbi:MAG: hypothetical protein ACREON_14210 [Gemmatimonadaceae bacterium]
MAATEAVQAQGHTGHRRHSPADSSHRSADSAYRAMQERGRRAMGVDQYTSSHQFEALPDGGRIELQRQEDDSAGTRAIREHLREVALAFSRGDFETPAFVHDGEVPGARTMAERRNVISYQVRDLPRGGEIRITTRDSTALAAIHEFLAFQRAEHGH